MISLLRHTYVELFLRYICRNRPRPVPNKHQPFDGLKHSTNNSIHHFTCHIRKPVAPAQMFKSQLFMIQSHKV